MKRSGFSKKASKPMKRTPLRGSYGFAGRFQASRIDSPARKFKKRVETQAKLKKELDRVFSIYIRQLFPKKCYTCNKTNCVLQCGHFVSRSYLATRWDENNCRPQCVGCNMYGGGKTLDFEERLKAELGSEAVESIKARRHQIIKPDRNWYKETISFYKDKIQ